MKYNILLVCTGNTCRSPMAEVILKQLLAERGVPMTVTSAGTAAMNGSSAAHNAMQVMREEGLDLSGHRSTLLTRDLVEDADLILTMSSTHKDTIRAMNPAAIEKTFSLKEFVGEAGDVEDPVGQSVEVYRQTAASLRRLLEKSLEKLGFRGQGNTDNV